MSKEKDLAYEPDGRGSYRVKQGRRVVIDGKVLGQGRVFKLDTPAPTEETPKKDGE